jgi:FAD/FMN-containing dehydrogenase
MVWGAIVIQSRTNGFMVPLSNDPIAATRVPFGPSPRYAPCSTSPDGSGDRHARKIERIARALRERRSDRPVSLKKRAVSHQVPKPNDKRYDDEKIDISDLDEVIEFDLEAMTCTAEPGVTFADLVKLTLPLGLAPIVVPELDTITLGGAVAGCSLESMSFRYGGFHDGCLEYELVTAKGEVLHCTPDNEHRLVFQMIHGSFGTLGILSKLKFRLVPAKRFVHVRYEKYRNLGDYLAAIDRHFKSRDVDFMDGILHAPNELVLSVATFVDHAPYTNRYDWMKVYYLSTAQRGEDFLETRDYFFRYDNGVTNPTPKSALGRLLFGRFLHSAQLLRLAEKLHRFLPAKSPGLTLDVFIPFSKVEAFMTWYQEEIGHFPLWCVPYRRVHDYEWLSPNFWASQQDALFVDLAIYGHKQPSGRNLYREIEEELVRVNGIKTLISYNYYDPDVFWTIWNKPSYLAVKKLTDPDNLFRDLYSKTCRIPRGLAEVSLVE